MPRLDVVTDAVRSAERGHTVTISGPQARHLSRTRRIRQGQAAVIKDGMGTAFSGEAALIRPDRVEFRLLTRIPCPDDTLPLVLVPAIIKGRRMDWLIQKACELGTREIMPVITRRTVARPEGGSRRVRRWRDIAVQALQQCSGNRLTRVHAPAEVNEFLDNMGDLFKIMLWEKKKCKPLPSLLGPLSPSNTVLAILTGPEGGFSQDEAVIFMQHGFIPASLGTRILRAETAAVAAAATVTAWREGAG